MASPVICFLPRYIPFTAPLFFAAGEGAMKALFGRTLERDGRLLGMEIPGIGVSSAIAGTAISASCAAAMSSAVGKTGIFGARL